MLRGVLDELEPFVYGRFQFDEHGLDKQALSGADAVTPTDGIECLHQLMYLRQRRRFWIGDLIDWGMDRWGERYTALIETTGYDYNTLANWRWIASRIDPSRRRSNLGWSQHREVAKLTPEQQELILARAEREGWTKEKVCHEVNRLGYEAVRPAGSPLLSGLHHGDCRQVIATLPDESIDLLLTDPPTKGPHALKLIDDVLGAVAMKLKPSSHAFLIVEDWETYLQIAPVVEKHLELRNQLMWETAPRDASGLCYWLEPHAVILYAQTGRRHLNGPREGGSLAFEPVADPVHPQEKPLPLIQYLIEKATQPKEVVLDPFCATGSTCVAAHLAGRRYVGIEREHRWLAEAQRRLAFLAEE